MGSTIGGPLTENSHTQDVWKGILGPLAENSHTRDAQKDPSGFLTENSYTRDANEALIARFEQLYVRERQPNLNI